jgi:hypothetical protein
LRKTTDRPREFFNEYSRVREYASKSMKENRKVSTCKWLDWDTLGSPPMMPNIYHCLSGAACAELSVAFFILEIGGGIIIYILEYFETFSMFSFY